MVFENRVLRRIFGPKRDKVKGEWRKLHNEELNDPYSSSNIPRVIESIRIRWVGYLARIGEGAEVHTGFWWGPLGRPRRRWGYNIKMDLQEVGCGSMDWIELAQDWDSLAGNCESGNESLGSIKCR